ncbi:DUF6518 family protein [Micromonospora sp. URMC 105]|uniref:DUF6518 family protein n=1 Tax=Micromonospora sp. URMC 105 TaxID=3423413 RepID=UPI003F1960DA
MRTPLGRLARTALPAGVLLGFLDFVWIKYLPPLLGDLGNSSAVWAVAAFLYAFWLRASWWWAAAGAAAGLVVAVPSYYLAATLIQHDDLAVLWAPTSILWMCFGVLAGVVFGVGGTWAREQGRRQVVGVALPSAVLFAEAALLARRIGHPDYGSEPLAHAAIRVALGVLIIVLAGRTNRHRLLALATALPLTLAGFGAFLIGFR